MKNRTLPKIFYINILVYLLPLLLGTHVANAQGDQSKISVKLAGTVTTGAWLHLPDDYDKTNNNYPLLIFLHGVGEGGSVDAVLRHGVPRIIANGGKMDFTVGGKLFKFIVVSPQIPNGWANETMVQSVMDDIKARYRVDASRVYLTGLSAGGYGVLNYVASGTKYSDNLAAIVPVSASAISTDKVNGLCNVVASKVPVWMLCGGNDSFLQYLTSYTNKINSCNPAVKAIGTVYPGGGHDDGVWDKAYDATHQYQQPNIYEWMLQYQRGESGTPPVTTPPPAPAPVPVVASSKINISLPINTVTLDGSGSTAPNSTINSYVWSQQSGPSNSSITSSSKATTAVNNLIAGTYIFRLTISNTEGASASTEVTVTVNAAPPPNNTQACSYCKFLISPGADGGAYINGENMNVMPGDTVCVQAGDYSYIQFFNFSGSAEKPIVFINCGGLVRVGNGGNYGLIFNNVKYFKVTGSGSSDKYGFRIDGVAKKLNTGLAMGKGCTDYEAERIEMTGSEVGAMAKVNPDCDPMNQYPNFAIRNVKLHDLYIHDVIGEGMYVGNTAPNGTELSCDGATINALPPRIYNLKIYNVITENTGWDGIQVASAPENVEIYNNSVYNFGTINKGTQQAGIILGGESNGKVYNNKIIKGTGNGIEVFGTGLCYVYNNIISDAGIDGSAQGQDALFVDDRPTANNYKPLQVYLFNNTIVNSGRDGIRLQSTKGSLGTGNLIYNNLVISSGSGNAIAIGAGVDYKSSNNITGADINTAKFVNASGKDFHLAAGSPAINAGLDLSAYFKTDIDADPRPIDGAFDSGADEYTGDAPVNKAPVASAGNDLTITLPVNTVNLNGSASTDPDGTIAGYAWKQLSGPVTVKFGTAGQMQTVVNGLTEAGTYVFSLTVTDNKGATNDDQLSVVVKPAPVPENTVPVAAAGNDLSITLPVSTASLDGSASHDPDGTISSYLWKQVSGPVTAKLSTAQQVQTNISGLTTAGTYVFSLTITDDAGATSQDQISIVVKPEITPENKIPVADAGSDLTITLPVSTASLNGSASQDQDGTISSYAWKQVSGPVTVKFGTAQNMETAISGLTTAGTYVFSLTVTDDKGATAQDEMQVVVNPAAIPGNKAPIANAGNNLSVTLPESTVNLNGSASYDPDGTISSYAWSQVSGPVTAKIGSAQQVQTGISGLTVAGTYVFSLKVTDDKGAAAQDEIQVIVSPAAVPENKAPIANAGNNLLISLPENTVNLNGSASYDPDGTISSYAWSQVSGPVTAKISSAQQVQTGISGLTIAGAYIFALKVTDNKGATAQDQVSVTVTAASERSLKANAGTNQTIRLPENKVTLDGSLSSVSNGEIVKYSWQLKTGPRDGVVIENEDAVSTVATFYKEGIYLFTLIITDDAGNTASAVVSVVVQTNDHEAEIDKLELFPNPAQSRLWLRLVTHDSASLVINIFNAEGKIMTTYNPGAVLSSLQHTFDINSYPAGLYILQITDGFHFNQTRKFIKVN